MLFLLILVFLNFLGGGSNVFAENENIAQNGIVTISQFPQEDRITLDGQWEFYWEKLYTPKDFTNATIEEKPLIVDVPIGKNGYTLGGKKTVSEGYGTYRLLIQFPESEVGTEKELFIPSISSAYTLWIDGKLMASNGKVGTSKKTMEPENFAEMVQFQVNDSLVEIVIQNSNFNQRKAGIYDSIIIGNPDVMNQFNEGILVFRTFTIACLLIIGLYHITLFAYRRKELTLIFFGLLCILIALRSSILEDKIVAYLFPFINWNWSSRLEYLGTTLGILLLTLFIYVMYRNEMNRKMMYGIVLTTSGYSLFIMLVPVMISTKLMLPMQLMLLVILIYLVFICLLAIIRKRDGYILNAIGITVLFLTAVNDTLFYNNIIQSTELFSVGLTIYLVLQSMIISKNYSNAFYRSEALAKDLIVLNESLEGKVHQRTEQLNQKNEELQTVNSKLMEAQQASSKLISNISHEVGTPLTVIQTYTKGMLDGIIEKDQKYLELIHERSIYLSKILEDLTVISDLENRTIQFQLQKIDIRHFSQRVYESQKLMMEKEGINWEYENRLMCQKGSLLVNIDPIRMEQVIINLVNNAKRFIPKHGKIGMKLSTYNENEAFIQVWDNGIGIDKEDIHSVFDRFFSTGNNNYTHQGAGLGLTISKEIVEYHQGRIWVESKKGEGTCFKITLPMIKE